MGSYWSLLGSVTLPLFLICVFGAVLYQWRRVDTVSLADISLYILAPCLLITALAGAQVSGGSLLSVLWFTVIQTALCWIVAVLVGRICRLRPETRASMTLTTLFSNSNNYGLPVLLLAYGTKGFSLGATYVVGQVILVNTLGLYIASRANGSPRQAIKKIAQTPLIYAAIIGLGLYFFAVHIPAPLESTLKLAGDAYPVIVLLILGIQLRKIQLSGMRRYDIWISVGLRVLIVPLLSLLTLRMLGIHGLLASILFVESSMPAAINATVLVEKYGGDKQNVALTVAITTILSFATLPLLMRLG